MTQSQTSSPPQLPQLRLDFYDTAVLLSRWQADGRVTTYPVSVQDVVTACTSIEMSSGLLPANTLFWKQKANQFMIGIYIPARRWSVQTDERDYHIPLPPLVFVGNGRSYQVYAVKKRPALSATQPHFANPIRLYHAPCPNVHHHGDICQGRTPFPICTPQTIHQACHLFLEGSLFNADLSQGKSQSYSDDVRQLWADINGRKRFPLSDLAPTSLRLENLF